MIPAFLWKILEKRRKFCKNAKYFPEKSRKKIHGAGAMYVAFVAAIIFLRPELRLSWPAPWLLSLRPWLCAHSQLRL